ncbi:MAG TPA: flagellar biosynthesis protein FliQ [Alphaproteobacteria bacterium]|jgi:flagellar biosynthetic protein FliQ
MDAVQALDVSREMVLVTLKIGAPVMLIALVVGLAVSLFQALTQIQEMTLSFIPKMIAIFLSLLLLMPFMLSQLTTFTNDIAQRIVHGS